MIFGIEEPRVVRKQKNLMQLIIDKPNYFVFFLPFLNYFIGHFIKFHLIPLSFHKKRED